MADLGWYGICRSTTYDRSVGIVFGASAEWGPGTGFAICVEGETLCGVAGDARDRSRIEKGWDSGR
jgi:hypothetical protein